MVNTLIMTQDEKRLYIFIRDKWKCRRCSKSLQADGVHRQLAHNIPKRKMYLRKYGPEIIHHPANLTSVCSLKCNSYFDLGCKEQLIINKVEEIKKIIIKEKELINNQK